MAFFISGAINLAVYLAPIGNGFQFLDTNGKPLNAGLLNVYAAGTTTPINSYTTSLGNVANSNPIVLGVDGRPPNEIWFTQGTAYKFVLTDSLLNPIGNALDNLWGINDPQFGQQWAIAGGTADAITAVYTPPNTTLVDGQLLGFRAPGANTITNPTFSPDGLTPRTITKLGGSVLGVGDIPGSLAESLVRYNLANTRWELLNPAGFSSGTLSTTFTFDGGGGSTGTLTLEIRRSGNFVNLFMPTTQATTGVGSVTLSSNSALPTWARPSAAIQYQLSAPVLNNGVGLGPPGLLAVTTAGIVTLNRDGIGTAFTNAATAGTSSPTSISYYVG